MSLSGNAFPGRVVLHPKIQLVFCRRDPDVQQDVALLFDFPCEPIFQAIRKGWIGFYSKNPKAKRKIVRRI